MLVGYRDCWCKRPTGTIHSTSTPIEARDPSCQRSTTKKRSRLHRPLASPQQIRDDQVRERHDCTASRDQLVWLLQAEERHRAFDTQRERNFTKDKLGLKKMNQERKLEFLAILSNHMQISKSWFVENVIEPYLRDQATTKIRLQVGLFRIFIVYIKILVYCIKKCLAFHN
jgi:hypothetical protein